MREILFRGKRVDNGEWETGSLVYARLGTSEEQASIADKMTAYHTPVIPETVGQYTGLTDKNGTRIFEGDIVKITGFHTTAIAAVKYGSPSEKSTSWGWYFDDNDGHTYFLMSKAFCRDYNAIIIGNIHDNPELLKGE
jgi:phage uncharacterized protein TIGR01671